jgi:hypothetical protein
MKKNIPGPMFVLELCYLNSFYVDIFFIILQFHQQA